MSDRSFVLCVESGLNIKGNSCVPNVDKVFFMKFENGT